MTIRAEHVIERQGKRYVLYPGLLREAHEVSGGRLHIATTLLQVPGPENGHTAICLAETKIVDEAGVVVRSTTGIGDASPENVSRQLQNALIRFSETRAKARALRDLVNIAEAVDETEHDDAEAAPARPAHFSGRPAPDADGRLAPPIRPTENGAPAPAKPAALPGPDDALAYDEALGAWQAVSDAATQRGIQHKALEGTPPLKTVRSWTAHLERAVHDWDTAEAARRQEIG